MRAGQVDRPKNQGIQDAEDNGVGADADGQRDDRRQGKARRLDQLTERDSQIVCHDASWYEPQGLEVPRAGWILLLASANVIPQGLKPAIDAVLDGTAQAVPFQGTVYATSSREELVASGFPELDRRWVWAQLAMSRARQTENQPRRSVHVLFGVKPAAESISSIWPGRYL